MLYFLILIIKNSCKYYFLVTPIDFGHYGTSLYCSMIEKIFSTFYFAFVDLSCSIALLCVKNVFEHY
jgi:hypothetical protein